MKIFKIKGTFIKSVDTRKRFTCKCVDGFLGLTCAVKSKFSFIFLYFANYKVGFVLAEIECFRNFKVFINFKVYSKAHTFFITKSSCARILGKVFRK